MKKERDYDRGKNPVIVGAVIQKKPKITELVNLFSFGCFRITDHLPHATSGCRRTFFKFLSSRYIHLFWIFHLEFSFTIGANLVQLEVSFELNNLFVPEHERQSVLGFIISVHQVRNGAIRAHEPWLKR